MQIEETEIEGCFILTPKIFFDSRGYFYESFNQATFEKLTGVSGSFVQDNQSVSSYGVIRGLHAQRGEHAQAKLVRVTQGKVLDVAVDLRPNSTTYGKHVAVELSDENKKQLFIPRDFLHGFSVLSETVEFQYKCDNYYNKESEYGVLFNDQTLSIDWRIPEKDAIISEKDIQLKSFLNIKND